jgi:bifunctional DNase/RNase
MIEVVIDSIRVSLISQQRIVMLRDVDGDNQLPIWIGPCEAEAIGIQLQETELARPLTHDLLRTAIETLGGSVSHILISELRDSVFHATIFVTQETKSYEIDSRPSDAIALAVRVKCPLFVSEQVMEEAGITPEPDITLAESETSSPADIPGEELDAFRDFLQNLDEE